MTFWSLAEIILGFVAIVGIGWVLRRVGLLKREDARPINNIIIYAGLPAMIFQAVHPAGAVDRRALRRLSPNCLPRHIAA